MLSRSHQTYYYCIEKELKDLPSITSFILLLFCRQPFLSVNAWPLYCVALDTKKVQSEREQKGGGIGNIFRKAASNRAFLWGTDTYKGPIGLVIRPRISRIALYITILRASEEFPTGISSTPKHSVKLPAPGSCGKATSGISHTSLVLYVNQRNKYFIFVPLTLNSFWASPTFGNIRILF